MRTLIVTWDTKSTAVIKNRKVERAVLAAAKKAGGDALRAARAEAKRRTRERVRIRAGYLANKALPLTFARGSTLEALEWRMDVSGRAVPLGEYPRRQVASGVSVEVVRGQRTILKSAFLATARSGRESVFLRPTKKAYPMGHRLGLNVADSMKDGVVPGQALARASTVFGASFTRLFPLELSKLS